MMGWTEATPNDGTCKNCGKEIKVAIYKGGRWCSELCRKALAKE